MEKYIDETRVSHIFKRKIMYVLVQLACISTNIATIGAFGLKTYNIYKNTGQEIASDDKTYLKIQRGLIYIFIAMWLALN